MVHLTTEVEVFGSLDLCSSFPFENYMQKLKRIVSSENSPFTQLVKRLGEMYATKIPEEPSVSQASSKKPDNVYIIDNTSCCEVIEDANDFDTWSLYSMKGRKGKLAFKDLSLCNVEKSMHHIF